MKHISISLQLHSQQHKNPQPTNCLREKLHPLFFGRFARFNGETKIRRLHAGNSAIIHERRGWHFKSAAINKRDKSPQSIFHRRAILSSAPRVCFVLPSRPSYPPLDFTLGNAIVCFLPPPWKSNRRLRRFFRSTRLSTPRSSPSYKRREAFALVEENTGRTDLW